MTVTLAGPPFAGPNRIALKSKGRYDEGICGVAFYPGMLVEHYSNSGVLNFRPHSTSGGAFERTIALEQPYGQNLGQTIATPAVVGSAGNPVMLYLPGDELYFMIPNGSPGNIAFMATLMSNGDGTLIASSGTAPALVGHALEAKNNTAGADKTWLRVHVY